MIKLIDLQFLLYQKNVRIFITSVVIGEILKILSKSYMINYQQLLKDSCQSKSLYHESGINKVDSTNNLFMSIIWFLANHGVTVSLLYGSVVLIGKLPPNSINQYLHNAFYYNFLDLKKSKSMFIDREKIYIDQYKNLEYLLKIILDEKGYYITMSSLINFIEKDKSANLFGKFTVQVLEKKGLFLDGELVKINPCFTIKL